MLNQYGLKANDAILAEKQHLGLYEDLIQNRKAKLIPGGAAQNTARGVQVRPQLFQQCWILPFYSLICAYDTCNITFRIVVPVVADSIVLHSTFCLQIQLSSSDALDATIMPKPSPKEQISLACERSTEWMMNSQPDDVVSSSLDTIAPCALTSQQRTATSWST
jgi:hypothetical protein